MLSAFTNSLKIPELRNKIGFTLMLLIIARVGANIPLPGFNPGPVRDFFAEQATAGGGLVGMYNLFTGGALLNGALFALGIMPYISASIIMQLMGAVFPAIARLQQEGDVGRQKINQYTRYLTIGICLVQGILLLVALSSNPASLIGSGFNPAEYGNIVITGKLQFLVTGTIFLTAGSMVMVWLGEQITEKGIGNGISLLITISIISGLPAAVSAAYAMFNAPVGTENSLNAMQGVLMLALLFVVTAALVAVTQGQRKIPVQYAKRMVGSKVFGGQSSFLPLKVNYAGVMPVIFGSAILMFPTQILTQLGSATGYQFFSDFAAMFQGDQPLYYITFGLLIFVFSYFWVSMMFKPVQIADDLKKNGGYIPGVRPGEPTAKFLDYVMTRLTMFGAISLTVIALFPNIVLALFAGQVPYSVALFFGGTGMLITVGVILDTMRQIETFLLQRHYDGFLKKGKIRSRSTTRVKTTVDTAAFQSFWGEWRILILFAGALYVLGIVSWFLKL